MEGTGRSPARRLAFAVEAAWQAPEHGVDVHGREGVSMAEASKWKSV